jgi:hypothetical protein
MLEQIDFLVFNRPPKPLDEHLVHPAPAAVPADFYSKIQQAFAPLCGGELAPLVGVENFRDPTGSGQRVFRSFQTETSFHGVGNGPTQQLARVPIYHRAPVGGAARHRHVGNIDAPDRLGSGHLQIPEQVGILAVAVVRNPRARLALDRFVTHLPTESWHALPVEVHAVIALQDGRSFTVYLAEPGERARESLE